MNTATATFRTAAGALLLGALLSAPLGAQFGEIRGRSFEVGAQLQLDGQLSGLPLQTPGLPGLHEPLPPLMQGLEVLPDPVAPGDPARVLVRLRLPVGAGATQPLHLDLRGQWDAQTGRLQADDTVAGWHVWPTPFVHEVAGLEMPAALWLIFVQPRVEFSAQVVIPPGDTSILGLHLTGSGLTGAPGLGARFTADAVYASWTRPDADSPLAALVGPVRLGHEVVALGEYGAEYRFLLGDLDGDLLYTAADVQALQMHFGPVTEASAVADMNADGQIDAADEAWLRLMLRLFPAPPVAVTPAEVGQVTPLPAGAKGSKPQS